MKVYSLYMLKEYSKCIIKILLRGKYNNGKNVRKQENVFTTQTVSSLDLKERLETFYKRPIDEIYVENTQEVDVGAPKGNEIW